ncbi:Kinesin-related protein 3 [Tetrabaena socialis]|uniref:Kinesin-related protein 3 n=1 Tax=Tetrabaena socialis TaxID=47790 RepID=A0A2J8AAK1_9CHLO|nr:Kinesin-related protein 3 [Tetrabaena socialis]|eukprot:PNH09544.1 Kinesin-related protein 3 [Tetrabaena socialis]
MGDPGGAAPVTSSGTTVRARFRPRSSKEAEVRCVDYQGASQIAFTGPDGGRNTFGFDKIYGEASSQADVFQDLRFVVEAALQGYNGTIMATSMNETSSRSHCIVTVRADKTLRDGTVQSGKLVMVDLAGSERADRTNAMGTTLAEGSLINKSLSCLSNVIQALTEDAKGGKPRHVPYRDSKLTRVLQDSLGGSARTVLVVCCSPCLENAAETLSTLRFGAR